MSPGLLTYARAVVVAWRTAGRVDAPRLWALSLALRDPLTTLRMAKRWRGR